VYSRPFGRAQFSLLEIEPAPVAGRMSFHSDPPRKLAIAAIIRGTAYRGTQVSLSASAKPVQRIDAITIVFRPFQEHAITRNAMASNLLIPTWARR
jgi:hypothetical protein